MYVTETERELCKAARFTMESALTEKQASMLRTCTDLELEQIVNYKAHNNTIYQLCAKALLEARRALTDAVINSFEHP